MYLYGVFCVCVCVCVCARVWSIGEGDAFLGVYRRCGGRGQASCCHWIGQVSDRYCPSCLQGTYMFGLIYIYIFISRARALAHAHNTQIHMHTHIRTHTQTYIHTYICVQSLICICKHVWHERASLAHSNGDASASRARLVFINGIV